MSRALRHAHKYYYGLKIGGSSVWACAFPFCNHYMPKHQEGRVENKLSICWQCGEEFVLETQLMNRPKPICIDCLGLGGLVEEIRKQEDPILRASQERLDKLIPKEEVSSENGKCRMCGKPTLTANTKLCALCMFK